MKDTVKKLVELSQTFDLDCVLDISLGFEGTISIHVDSVDSISNMISLDQFEMYESNNVRFYSWMHNSDPEINFVYASDVENTSIQVR